MKGQTIEIIKDLIVSLLIVVCIGIVLSILFYDDIALGESTYLSSTIESKELSLLFNLSEEYIANKFSFVFRHIRNNYKENIREELEKTISCYC